MFDKLSYVVPLASPTKFTMCACAQKKPLSGANQLGVNNFSNFGDQAFEAFYGRFGLKIIIEFR